MKCSFQAKRWLSVVGACALACGGLASHARGGEEQLFRLESVGARAGFPVSANASGFKEAELFANWFLPWRWDLGRDWYLQTRVDASVGWLADSQDDAVVATLGPTLVLGWRDWPVTLEGGISPTLLSESHFPTKNLGYPFQFTSHAGLNWDFTRHFRLSYRFQHMSNAGMSVHNPGLNLHEFGLSYLF